MEIKEDYLDEYYESLLGTNKTRPINNRRDTVIDEIVDDILRTPFLDLGLGSLAPDNPVHNDFRLGFEGLPFGFKYDTSVPIDEKDKVFKY